MKPFPLALALLLLAGLLVFRRRLTLTLALIGLTLALLFALYGSGIVPLPGLEETVEGIGPALGRWAYLLVGALVFLETGAFVGLVAPGEVALVLGGFIAGQGEIDLLVLIPLAWAAAVAGDTTSYMLGRKLGRGFLLRHGPKVKIGPAQLEKAERFFAAHGGKTILIGRFVGVVRAVAPFMAGASRMPLRRFLSFDIVGAGLWSVAFVVLGYLSWQSFDDAVSLARRGKLALALLIVAAVAAFIAYRRLRPPARHRPQAAPRADAGSPAPLEGGGVSSQGSPGR